MYDNRQKIITVLIIITLIFSLFTLFVSSEGVLTLSARAAVLYEPETERFVYTKNADEKLGMASTTKIMTALVALENLDPDETVAIDDRAVGLEGSSIYLKHGEIMNAEGLIYSLMLQSANDAAAALAYHLSGSIEEFARLMNDKAKAIGLQSTNFTNPHGLDDKMHYTSARDLALITAEALKNEKFKQIVSTERIRVESSDSVRLLTNHNKLLKNYDGCIGVKTGYTKRCGRCLVSAAVRDELTFISVTLDAPNDWSDHEKMLDLGYSLMRAEIVCAPGDFYYEIPIINGKRDYVSACCDSVRKVISYKTDSEIRSHVKLSRYFSAPINNGDVLGCVIFTRDGKEIAREYIVAVECVEARKNKRKLFTYI